MKTHTDPHSAPAGIGLRLGRTAVEILDSLSGGVVVADRNGRVRYRNTVAAKWLAEGTDLQSVLQPVELCGSFAGWSTELPRMVEDEALRRLGGVLHPADARAATLVALSCTPLRQGPAAVVTGIIIQIEEATYQNAVEDKLEVSKRLTSLGKLATRVAHELNNPLDGILRYTTLALRLVENSSEAKLKSYLTQSRTGLVRMCQIIGDLLQFARTTEGEFDEVGINEVVEQALEATAVAAEEANIVVTVDFQKQNMPTVRGSRLYQVCCNLIKNAIDAMPEGGRLAITTGMAGDDVVIRVADTGVGLSEPVEKLFQPFFTTKAPGKGTGLGLAISRDFIEEMNGTITAESAEEGGAIFTVRVPIRNCHNHDRNDR